MRLVLIESPYAGDVDANIAYARRAMADSLARGEAPFASHLLYTQLGILNDADPDERALGIEAGLAWGAKADATVVYIDRGISNGMNLGIQRAVAEGRPVEIRRLEGPLNSGKISPDFRCERGDGDIYDEDEILLWSPTGALICKRDIVNEQDFDLLVERLGLELPQ